MIRSFKSKALAELWEKGRTSKIDAKTHERVLRRLDRLDAATKRNPDRCPTHPGALLREDVIPATDKTKAEIAQLLGISRQLLYDVLRER
jgi:hypothetical protein